MVFYGSGALAVRGLASSRETSTSTSATLRRRGRIFDDLLITPVERMHRWVAKYAGRAFWHAIIEWLSEPLAEHDDVAAPHEQGPFIAGQLEEVQWRGHRVRMPRSYPASNAG